MSSWIYTHARIMTTSSTSAMRDQKHACNSLEVRREKLGLCVDFCNLLRVEPRPRATRTETSHSRIQNEGETTGSHADALVVASKPAKQWTHNTPPPSLRGISKKIRDSSHRQTSGPSPNRDNVLEWSPKARDRPSFHASRPERACPRQPEPAQARPPSMTTNTQRAPNNQKPRAYAMVSQTQTKSKTQ